MRELSALSMQQALEKRCLAPEEWKGYLLMGEYSVDDPVHDMGNAVADMAEIIIEAIFNGDDVTLQTVGNCLDVFLPQLRERIVRVEMLNEIMGSRFYGCMMPWAVIQIDITGMSLRHISPEERRRGRSRRILNHMVTNWHL